MIDRRTVFVVVGWHLLLAACFGMIREGSAEVPGEGAGLFDPRRPIERELEISVNDGFTLVSVGDCIISRPLTPTIDRDPEFAAVVELLRRGDVTFGNLETSIFDIRDLKGHPYSGGTDWMLTAQPEVARDLREMGFDMLGRANNHALDWGVGGMRATSEWLDRAGLVHAGAGEIRASARAPAYLETASGRVALVSMATTYRALSEAMPPRGQAPGRPGINALRVTRVVVAPDSIWQHLEAVDRELKRARRNCRPGEEGEDEITAVGEGDEQTGESGAAREMSFLGVSFRQGDRLRYTYEMNEADVKEILGSIRLGKQHSDFLIATLHAHQTGLDCEEPGDFIPVLARRAIEAGADAVLIHGSHILGPVEIYSGKPIFYGLSNFFWSDIQEPLDAEMYEVSEHLLARAFENPADATDADLTAVLNASSFNDERVFQTVVAESRFEGGTVSEVRLYPVDLGYGRRLTESGVPRLATGEAARIILERLQRMSRDYGTTIAIEGDVAVIRPGG